MAILDGYLGTAYFSQKWGISVRQVQELAKRGRILGTIKIGNVRFIPVNAERPKDARVSEERQKKAGKPEGKVKSHNALVRDKVPELYETNGFVTHSEFMDDESYIKALKQMLVEQAYEYKSIENPANVACFLEITEIIHAILKHNKYSLDDFNEEVKVRRSKYGGYEGRTYLISTKK